MTLRVAAVWLAAGLCLSLVGCGSGTNITNGSGLQGSYAGVYRVVDGLTTEEGTLTLVIGRDGGAAGSMLEYTTGAARTLVGWVKDRGRLNATVTYPDATFSVSGDLTLVRDVNLVGVLTRRDAAGRTAGTFTIDVNLLSGE